MALPVSMKLYSEPRYFEIRTPDGGGVLVLKQLLSSFIGNEPVAPSELLAGVVLAVCPTLMLRFQRLDPKGGQGCTALAKHGQIFFFGCPFKICSMAD